jgi:exonuclease SbcD
MPTLLHTADWHLGKRLHDFRLLDEQREALARLVGIVDAERPDLIVVAGDLFDAPVPPVAALQAWEWAAAQLVDRRGVPVVVIPGNHDHAERIAMNARMARRAGLYVLNELATCHEPVRIAGVDVVGVPFHKPPHVRALRAATGETDDALDDLDYDGAMAALLDEARARLPGDAPSVLAAHAFVEGAGEEPEGEEAILVGGAGGVKAATLAGFDYVALGHLHRPRAIAGATVRYAGSLYPYAFGEPNAKSVTLVDLPEGGGPPPSVREAPLPARRQVRVVQGMRFDEVLEEGRAMRADPERAVRADDYLLVRVSDREPIDHALSRLREVHPHALLEQPEIAVQDERRRLSADVRTITPERAFLDFYESVYGEEPGGIELDLLRAALAGDDMVSDVAPGDEAGDAPAERADPPEPT